MNKIVIIRIIFIILTILIIRKYYNMNIILDKFNNNIESVSLDEFNIIFNTGINRLPYGCILVGINNDKIYKNITDETHYVNSTLTYFMNNIQPNLHKSKYFFILCFSDGYEYSDVLYPKNFPNLNDTYILTYAKYHEHNDKIIPIVDPHYTDSNGHLNLINEIDSNIVDWDNKYKLCIWKGDRRNGTTKNWINKNFDQLHPREYFIKLYNDKKYNNIDYPNEFINVKDHLKYKYILDMDGFTSTWSATIWKLYSGSVLLKQKSVWKQWYYDDLVEYVHYVPIANDFSDLNEQIQWCIDNDSKCKQITENSRAYVLEKLNCEQVKNKMINTFNSVI